MAAIVENECDDLGGPEEIGAIIIELDGPGVSCYDQLKRGRYASKVVGIHTGARLDDGKNYNQRARIWRKAKEYLSDAPVCLPKCPELKTQVASVKYKYKDGLRIVTGKIGRAHV